MTLKILRSDEPITITQLTTVIYSVPGLGKTTLGFSAESSLLLDFDKGAYRAASRGDTVQIDSWVDVIDISESDLGPYKTVVVDTAGRALDFLTSDIIRRFPKKGFGGALTLQGYGTLKAEFTAWLKMLRMVGKDVVLIAHSSEDKNGDDLIERLDVQGGSKGEIYKSADAMGRLHLVNGKRTLSFSPTDTAFGKNPGNLTPLLVPEISKDPHFLADVIQTIKDKINTLTEEQQNRQEQVAGWVTKFSDANTAGAFNKLVTETKKADTAIQKTIQGALHKIATDAGYVYDKKDGYIAKEQEAA
jgi:hypothetical protein